MSDNERIDPKRTFVKVSEILDHIGAEICDKYCKWPEQYKDEKGDEMECKLYDEHCEKCPLNMI